jgi:hypothetical protein
MSFGKLLLFYIHSFVTIHKHYANGLTKRKVLNEQPKIKKHGGESLKKSPCHFKQKLDYNGLLKTPK